MLRPRDEPELEEVEDALVDGDVAYQRGTAQAAFRNRNFRIVYLGTFASNIGTWMQNVVLGAYALEADGLAGLRRPHVLRPARAAAVPVAGGWAARRHVDRRRLLVTSQVDARAPFVRARRASCSSTSRRRRGIVVFVFAIGIANALGAPGPERDPADARAARRPARRGRAAVGADEPVACHRARDRRRALRRASTPRRCS